MAGRTSKPRETSPRPKLKAKTRPPARRKNVQYEKWEQKDRTRLTFYAPDKMAEVIREEAYQTRVSKNTVIVKLLEFAIESRPTMVERPPPP